MNFRLRRGKPLITGFLPSWTGIAKASEGERPMGRPGEEEKHPESYEDAEYTALAFKCCWKMLFKKSREKESQGSR